jgi:hypothetical protein
MSAAIIDGEGRPTDGQRSSCPLGLNSLTCRDGRIA